MASGRVSSACARCRRQKLKCDISRPCVMCVRASASCVKAEQDMWRVEDPAQRYDSSGKPDLSGSSGRSRKRLRTTLAQSPEDATTENARFGRTPKGPSRTCPAESANGGGSGSGQHVDCPHPESDAWEGSSSTIELVAKAFHGHDATSVETPETSALGYSHAPHSSAPDAPTSPNYQYNLRIGRARAAPRELWDTLPNWEVVSILIENYFEKIHWFVLLFHQGEFRKSSRELFSAMSTPASQKHDYEATGRVSVLLAVCALSLECLDTEQERRLSEHGSEAQALRQSILSALKLNLLDILAHGSLEAVQTTVLLSNYYLSRGEPELARPLCGCALQLAQAIKLHRRPHPVQPRPQQVVEARKRCWWAIYEIETFMSMIYGFPLSISDYDCDVEPLDMHDPWSLGVGGRSSSRGGPTLLSYKCAVSELSKVVKSALTGLYKSCQVSDSPAKPQPATSEQGPLHREATIKRIILLGTRLSQWYSNLPAVLKMGKLTEAGSDNLARSSWFHPDIESRTFENNLFRLQALALKLAYENTRILIHRPLLPYSCLQHFGPTDGPPGNTSGSAQTFRALLQSCRDAAIQISRVGSLPIFREAADTFAVNFISLHLLTAAVALCITISSSVLSPTTPESKIGIRRIMQMQALLRAKSTVAEQGLQVVWRLLELAMQKETKALLDIDTEDPFPETPQERPTTRIAEGIRRSRNLEARRTETTDNSGPFFETAEGSNTVDGNAARYDAQGGVPESNGEAAILALDGHGDSTVPSDFYDEDTLSSMAVSNFEEALNNNIHATSLYNAGYMSPFPVDFTSECVDFGQDQNWLWDPAFNAGFMDQGGSVEF